MAILKKLPPRDGKYEEKDKRISDKMSELLQMQIEGELESSHIYQGMANWCSYHNYYHAHKYLQEHVDEERGHMLKVSQYLADRNCFPSTPAISDATVNYSSLIEIVMKAFEREKYVTKSYQEVANAAMKEGDFMTFQLASEFLKEQVEEEANFINLIDRYEILIKGNTPEGLVCIHLDEEFSKL
jgi:ferritin